MHLLLHSPLSRDQARRDPFVDHQLLGQFPLELTSRLYDCVLDLRIRPDAYDRHRQATTVRDEVYPLAFRHQEAGLMLHQIFGWYRLASVDADIFDDGLNLIFAAPGFCLYGAIGSDQAIG